MRHVIKTNKKEIVVLIHGLWLPGCCLWPLARALKRRGFVVKIFSYASVSADLHENAAHLERFLTKLDAATIHLVGHSLGGILIRALFHYYPNQKPGRIVTLASPHQGCRVAQNLDRYGAWRFIMGRSVAQLLAGLPQTWPLPARAIGCLSGSRSMGTGRLLYRDLPRPNDGLLTLEESTLEPAGARIVLPVSHTGVLFARAVAEQLAHFLNEGRFTS
ncbi:MAG: alpha/beta hydrolase [Gammaproteobacteria bacterium]|nr:alpha/beta hydrolase [Gammaproteobacteria bacterium]